MSAGFLSVPEVAELLAVDRKTVYREIERGRLRAVKVGRTIRVPREAIEALGVENKPPRQPQSTAMSVAFPSPDVTFRSRTRTFRRHPPGR